MWKYVIYNNPKILFYTIIRNNITGVELKIPYKQLNHMREDVAENMIKEIVNKLNTDIK